MVKNRNLFGISRFASFSVLIVAFFFPRFFVQTPPALATPFVAATVASPARPVKNAQQKHKKHNLSFILSADVGINFLRGVTEIQTSHVQQSVCPQQGIQDMEDAIIDNYDRMVPWLSIQADEHWAKIEDELPGPLNEESRTVLKNHVGERFDEVFQALQARHLYVNDILTAHLAHQAQQNPSVVTEITRQSFHKFSSQGTLRGKLNMHFSNDIVLSPMVSITCKSFTPGSVSLQSGVSIRHQGAFISAESSYNFASNKRSLQLTFGKEFSELWNLFGRPISLKMESLVGGDSSFNARVDNSQIHGQVINNGTISATIDLVKFS